MNRHSSDAFAPQDNLTPTQSDEIDLGKLLGLFLRNFRMVAIATFLGVVLGIGFLSTTTRLYTSQVDINISGAADSDTFHDFSGVAGPRATEVQIETELQVLMSETVAERVVRALDLHQNTIFLTPPHSGPGRAIGLIRKQLGGAVGAVRSWLSQDLPDLAMLEITPEAEEIEHAVALLRRNMSVSSIRGSRVLQIRYTSASASLSARIANAIAQAYIEDQLEATDAASQRAIDWLHDRTQDLRRQSEQLFAIVEDFRAENNLLGVDIDRLADAEFERLTRNLVDARANLVELEALSRRLDEIVATEDTTAVVRETATQGITSGLRSRYLEVLRAYNNLTATLGEDHAQAIRRQRELQEIEALMFEEIRRSSDLTRNDVIAARERVRGLEAAQAAASERVGADHSVIAELRELEQDAGTVRDLYSSYLQRYQEALQRQQIPTSFARVLNRAQPANTPSSPRSALVLVLSAVLGFLLAIFIIVFREWRDDKVRSEEHVRSGLGLEYMGGLTILKGRSETVPARLQEQLPPNKRLVRLPDIMTFSVDQPVSNFAETLRTGKMSITLRHGQVQRAPRIGIVSCFPAEGKTTTAANFANLLAQQGARVVLIDGDMRNPGLTRALGREFDTGLVNVLLGEVDWRETVHLVQETGLHVIPNSKMRAAHTAELMGSNNMAALLDQLDQDYDYIFIDLPPIGPVVDARAILDKLDGVFFIIKWGGTALDVAQKILRMDQRLRDKCYGAFMNMFDPKKAQSYGVYQHYSYYRSYYKSYYRDG